METPKGKIPIKLQIGPLTQTFTVTAEEEEIYRKAALLVTEKYAKYKDKWKNLSEESYLSISALDFAVSYIHLQNRQDTQPYVDSIKQLTQDIENTL